MQLPGGMVREGTRDRSFAFRPVDGALEVALAEACAIPSAPRAVTAVLVAALEELGGRPADVADVRNLAVGDRQFLARQLAIHLGKDPIWLTAMCRTCGESFDFLIRQGDLPVKAAGEGFPFAHAGSLRLRVPTGADQEAIAELPDFEAMQTLFDRCRIEGSGDISAAEAALESVAPEVTVTVLAGCPACHADNDLFVDPYLGLPARAEPLFDEIHRLASRYHWTERDILALPRARRQLYLRLIERSRGWMA